MTKEICQECGKVFQAGPNAFFCPECRKEKQRAAVRRARLKEKIKKNERLTMEAMKCRGKIVTLTFAEPQVEQKKASGIVHQWLYRIKKAYGSGNIGLKWSLLRRPNGTFWVQVLLWGNAMDGEAENLWGEYGDARENTELSNPEKELVCSAWARRISVEEIEGGTLWKI
jgi:hypothetical protein